jgi:hypothetical protein
MAKEAIELAVDRPNFKVIIHPGRQATFGIQAIGDELVPVITLF